MTERIFGDIPGILVGSSFPTRLALNRAGVHSPTQAGISGTPKEGADSIVLSGGYEDDEDFGDVIIYTGYGGQDQITRKQTSDQDLTRQNLALAVSMQRGLPVRVVRGANHPSAFAPSDGYRYDGLFSIDSYWHEKGASGFQVWRYRLIKQADPIAKTQLAADTPLRTGNTAPSRSTTTVTRVIRDTALSAEIKQLYDFTCQVCGTRLQGPGGPYAEAAHVRPLGRPHDGPDTSDNLICFCPNHHFLFDVGAFGIRADLTLIGLSGQLTVHRKHTLNPDHLRYHRQHFGLIPQDA